MLTVAVNTDDTTSLNNAVDKELDAFDAWCTRNIGGAMTRYERAAIKTFLIFKLGARKEEPEALP